MKLFIDYDLRDGPWGGGNQFLRALSKEFANQNLLAASIDEANIVLVNSHHPASTISELLKWRRDRANRAVIHRLDGPISKTRGLLKGYSIDQKIFSLNRVLADGTIFQSDWSRLQNSRLGFKSPNPVTVIRNGSDAGLFFPRKIRPSRERVHIISTSWSLNRRKGFSYLKTIDKKLDFSRFDFSFVGRCPIDFKHIRKYPPLNSANLGNFLRTGDLFFTASKDDPCSNSLIEAIACGLIPIARRSGGHEEIIGERGFLFEGRSEAFHAIELACEALEVHGIEPAAEYGIPEVARRYEEFANSLLA